jgi:alkaline phosphatase D
MNLRACLFALLALVSGGCASQRPDSVDVRTVAFGSCLRQDKPAPILDVIASDKPDLFIFLGDNIYGDSEDMTVLKAKYAQVEAMSGFQKLRNTCPLLATWDDHDMGKNDAGVEYPKKEESKLLMLDFFGEPADSPRRSHEGVYDVRYFRSGGRTVQVILLDTRWFRSSLKRDPTTKATRYVSDDDRAKTILGDEQWKWLEQTLSQKADLRIIASSIQVISDQHRFEKWANFPHERARLLELLAKASGESVIISGDRHAASMHAIEVNGRKIIDVTASSFNQGANPGREDREHPLRLIEVYNQPNYGRMKIAWTKDQPQLTLEICDEKGDVVRSATTGW